MFYPRLPGLFIICLLASCASMDKSECVHANWYNIGFEDGSSGRPEKMISEYRKDCADHGVTPNLKQYRQGHHTGSETYCTASKGYNLGKNGHEYKGSCPADIEESFLEGYQDGMYLYSLWQKVKSTQRLLDNAIKRINDIDLSIADKSELMFADGLVREQRLAIKDEIDLLQEEKQQLQNQLPYFEQEFDSANTDYSSTLDNYNKKY